MPYPQATVHFQGIDDDQIFGGEANWNRGVTPSVCLLRMKPQDSGTPPQCGDLVFRWDGSSVIIWPKSAIDWATVKIEQAEEGVVWSVQCLDRRWEWWQQVITGAYNVPMCDGTLSNKKSAQELAVILLMALGETGYDVSDIPTNVYPYAYWDEALIPAELQSLCDKVNCVVHLLHQTDSVKLSRLGTGADLPTEKPERIHNTYPVTPHTRPQELELTTGPTLFQAAITLEAVGLDNDCIVKPIDDMTIKPDDGWEGEWPQFFSGVDKADRHLAFKSIYRWYRVKDFQGSLTIPGTGITLDSIEEILPLLGKLIDGSPFNSGEGSLVSGTKVICLDPALQGYYWPYVDLNCTTSASTPDHWDYHLNAEHGIVIFDEPVFKMVDECTAPAELELVVAFQVCRVDGCEAESFTKQLAGNGKGTFTLRRPSMRRRRIITPSCDSSGSSDNIAELSTEANAYLDVFPTKWEDAEGRDWKLKFIRNIELSGKIAQIKWKCGRMDNSFTRVSTYKEFDVYDWTYEQRRRMEHTKQLAHQFFRGA